MKPTKSAWPIYRGFIFLVAWGIGWTGSSSTLASSGFEGVISGVTDMRPVVFMVPGTGNSFFNGSSGLSSYFSDTIRTSIEESGFSAVPIHDLIPFGGFEENGDLVFEQVENWYKRNDPGFRHQAIFLSHSAGSFYSMWAAHQFAQQTKIQGKPGPRISHLLMLSAPLQGALLADRLYENHALRLTIEALNSVLKCFLSVKGLLQVRSQPVQEFLSKIQLAEETKLISFAGIQNLPKAEWWSLKPIWEWSASYYLAPIFHSVAKLINVASDGVVDFLSAASQNVRIHTTNGKWISITPVTEWSIPLDHPEQVLDYRVFESLGTQKAEWIDSMQRQYYPLIIQHGLTY